MSVPLLHNPFRDQNAPNSAITSDSSSISERFNSDNVKESQRPWNTESRSSFHHHLKNISPDLYQKLNPGSHVQDTNFRAPEKNQISASKDENVTQKADSAPDSSSDGSQAVPLFHRFATGIGTNLGESLGISHTTLLQKKLQNFFDAFTPSNAPESKLRKDECPVPGFTPPIPLSASEQRKEMLRLYKVVNTKAAQQAMRKSEVELEYHQACASQAELRQILHDLQKDHDTMDADLVKWEQQANRCSALSQEQEKLKQTFRDLELQRKEFDASFASRTKQCETELESLRSILTMLSAQVSEKDVDLEALRTDVGVAEEGSVRLSSLDTATETMEKELQSLQIDVDIIKQRYTHELEASESENESFRSLTQELEQEVSRSRKMRAGVEHLIQKVDSVPETTISNLNNYVAFSKQAFAEANTIISDCKDAIQSVSKETSAVHELMFPADVAIEKFAEKLKVRDQSHSRFLGKIQAPVNPNIRKNQQLITTEHIASHSASPDLATDTSMHLSLDPDSERKALFGELSQELGNSSVFQSVVLYEAEENTLRGETEGRKINEQNTTSTSHLLLKNGTGEMHLDDNTAPNEYVTNIMETSTFFELPSTTPSDVLPSFPPGLNLPFNDSLPSQVSEYCAGKTMSQVKNVTQASSSEAEFDPDRTILFVEDDHPQNKNSRDENSTSEFPMSNKRWKFDYK
mmetsp:Transcript_1627/g.2165  ORF Transcript_1627/g.2165 Transcript_1627/m.2165 type:complete len:693 (+) Transcript_1627:45-2123(+)|eukprot:CAMPEP_0201483062 /NCGR_PEP_ID=MMETSP0151_2-20130828/7292_1 /ASSEMBLY_ACC=CAM_ASM_000257 /TAXON_ID=200890 /ORGANISM="Paramoeba atlantica, Strain 621/1 / CCAP 1560/9" /LENGTH=692 /DNA_ID=CAMNT_0047866033 /DNA_START=53 /DNA_END=2131 /DNA_ORIENTATION=-